MREARDHAVEEAAARAAPRRQRHADADRAADHVGEGDVRRLGQAGELDAEQAGDRLVDGHLAEQQQLLRAAGRGEAVAERSREIVNRIGEANDAGRAGGSVHQFDGRGRGALRTHQIGNQRGRQRAAEQAVLRKIREVVPRTLGICRVTDDVEMTE